MDYYNKQWYTKKAEVSNNYMNYATPTFQTLDPRMKFPSSLYSSDSTANSSLQSKSDDELWVEAWLSKIGKIHINLDGSGEFKSADSSKRSVIKGITKISDAKSSLAKWFLILEKIQSTQEDLKSNVSTMTTSEWKKKTVEIGMLKDELTALMSQFENVEALKLLQRKINNRRKKRVNQKKRKKHLHEMKKFEFEERKKNDKIIDQWLENMKESVEKVKMVSNYDCYCCRSVSICFLFNFQEERMKKDADCVLAEVTKKKSEARKQLSLISSLVKLRTVREKHAQQRGEKTSSANYSIFVDTTEKLTKIWTNSLQVYMKEEQGLRLMLEQNAVEDSNAAKLLKEKKIAQEWEDILFGPKRIPSSAYWGLTRAERDLETFVAIRKSWDTFLAQLYDESASKIPIGWILPNSQPNENWAKFIEQ